MAASFFEQQQLARRNTHVMVALFLLAVAAIVVAVDLLLAALYVASQPQVLLEGAGWQDLLGRVPGRVHAWGALATAGVIFAVSAIHVTRLGGGGPALARMIGARPVAADTRDPLERRLLNVVEEMAIASGVRVPATYVMEGERGINAFAAGWDVSGAAIAVTRGTLEALTRDELQGVVAHEFSHILNGDMRLNIRMMGVLAGIVFVGSIGKFLLRNARGSRDKGAYAMAVGAALFVIGYVGLFFARLIKAAVSREREYLADASSVQFTRNPEGIAGALDQIRTHAGAALVRGRFAEEMSHMFFGQAVSMRFARLFDTHPPLEERIRRVHPRFRPAQYRSVRAQPEAPAPGGTPAAAPGPAAAFAGASAGQRRDDRAVAWNRTPAQGAGMVGTVAPGGVDQAARLLASLPAPLRLALREPDGAAAAVLSLLLAPDDAVRARQLQELDAAGLGALAGAAGAALAQTGSLGAAYRLPLIDLALPALKAAQEPLRAALLRALECAIHSDRRVSLHEFVVLTFLRAQLAPQPPLAAGRSISHLRAEAVMLLSLVARAGAGDAAQADRAFAAGVRELGLADVRACTAAELSLKSSAEALQALRALAPLAKSELVAALFAATSADGTVKVAETELLRLAGAVLDCPLPPLLPQPA